MFPQGASLFAYASGIDFLSEVYAAFFIIRTFEKSEPLTNIPLCAKNCIFKGSDFILGVLCFVKKRRRVIKYG